MASYPLTQFTPDDDNDQFVVPSGQVLYCEVPVSDGDVVSIRTVHISGSVQDFTLLCWLSDTPGGTSLNPLLPEYTTWHLRRASLFVNVLRTGTVDPTPVDRAPVYGTQVTPGSYYLNVLNLTNVPNAFYIQVTRGL